MSHRPPVSSELSRELSLFHVTMMGLGMMIGAGVFVGIGNAINHAGPGGMILTFALNGVLATFTAMSYAELSSAIPRAGGAYNFARVAFGRGTSFMSGWMEWFASSVAGALYAVCFATYTVRFFAGLGLVTLSPAHTLVVEKVVALVVACAFIYTNYRGASETGKIGAIMTLGQTLFLVVIGLIGALVAFRDPSRLRNFMPFIHPDHGWPSLLATMGFTYVAFEGYEVIAQAGDETIDPRRNLPKAMLYSVGIVTVTYVAVAFATVVAVKAGSPGVDREPWLWIAQFKAKGFGEAVARLMPFGNFFLTLAVIFASTSALNATIYSATRACYALGRDRMLPARVASVSRTRKTPWMALLLTTVIIVIVATLLPTMDVASSASIMFLFLFLVVNVCVIKVRRNMKDELTYGFLMPFFPVIPILAILAQAILVIELAHVSWIAWVVAACWIPAGLAVYTFYSRHHVTATEDEVLILEEEASREQEGYRIMVAVANPDNALSMVRQTYALCGAKQAQVELLHMVPVPEMVPLADAHKYMGEGKEAITEVALYLAPLFPLSSTIRYCRNVARGIVSAVRQKKADMLIMGWHGGRRSSRRSFLLGSTVDPVVELSPCDVVILKDCGDEKYRHILVPVAGGANSVLALEIASIIAQQNDGDITLFTVDAGNSRTTFSQANFLETHAERVAVPPERIRTRTVASRNIVEAIRNEAHDPNEGYDLVVIGCSNDTLFRSMRRGPVAEPVAAACRKPVVMVKTSGKIRSWIRRWL